MSAADSSVGVPRTDSAVLSIAVGPAAAPFYGSEGGTHLNQPIVGMAATPDGRGYWLVASDGGIFTFGDAALLRLDRRPSTSTSPSSGMAATPTGQRLLAGRLRRRHLHLRRRRASTARPAPSTSTSPSSAWPPRPTGDGYWLVASDGGIFTFGDAALLRLDRRHPPQPARSWAWPPPRRPRLLAGGLRRRHLHLRRRRLLRLDRGHRTSTARSWAWPSTADGGGYWLVASDGGIFTFGDAPFYGSTGWHAASTSPSWAWRPLRTAAATGWWPPTAASSASAPDRRGSGRPAGLRARPGVMPGSGRSRSRCPTPSRRPDRRRCGQIHRGICSDTI